MMREDRKKRNEDGGVRRETKQERRKRRQTRQKRRERTRKETCKICGQSGRDDEETFIVCDGCDQGFHTYCLSPPLQKMPKGKWFCVSCEKAAREVEFEDGGEHTIDGFREACAAFDLAFFGRNNPRRTQMLLAQQQQYGSFTIPREDVEESFWQMIEEGSHEIIEVRSASEIDTTRRGSGFPRTRDAPSSADGKKEEENETIANMRKSPWNCCLEYRTPEI